MKIDPTIQQLTGDSQSDSVGKAKSAATRESTIKADSASSASLTSGDTIQISGRHAQAQQLAAQLANVPEVRASRVNPLKAEIQQNTYQPDSGKIADAMLAEGSSIASKA
jgi:flagellar biosynthesis anti-sigma factor FlgM